MPVPNLFTNACAGKKQHKTLLAAEVYLDEKHHKTTAEIYECPICGFYHIGNQTGEKNKVKYKKKYNADEHLQHKNKLRRFRL